MLNRIRESIHAPVSRRLVAEFVSGDESAFATIYNRFNKPILSYIRGQVRDDEIAQDLAQEVFLKVHRFRDSYRDEFGFSTWLWTIARNTCFDYKRKGTMESSAETLEPHEPEQVPCPAPCAETLLQKRQSRRVLRRLLLSLTRPQRQVIWLRVIHQLSYEEISKRLGMSLSAAKCLAYRSKTAMTHLALTAQLNAASGVLVTAARVI